MRKFNLTNLEVKDRQKEVFFTINEKSKYKIPSKMFPLSRKKDIGFFFNENTVPYENEMFFNEIDKLDLPAGFCYSNAQKILAIGVQLKLDIHYFSGWIITPGDMPQHHAWIVIKHEAGFSIVDSVKYKLLQKAEELHPVDRTNSDWRKESVVGMKLALKELPNNHQQIGIGIATPGVLYIGSPDTIENARSIFQKLAKEFPNHPSYNTEGQSMTGRSKWQEEMHKQGIE